MDEESDIEGLAPWLVLLITLVGGGLRVFLLAKQGLGLDETFSLWLANHNAADMLHWIGKIDPNPPLYYLLLHYWIDLKGATPYELRLLSALFGAATIPVIYLTGKRLSGVMMGLASAVLLALSPFNIRYAQETGMYTLLTFNAAAAIYALARLLTDPRSVRPIGSQFREYLRAWRIPRPAEPNTADYYIYKDSIRNQSGWRAWIFNRLWPPIQTIETDLAWAALIVFSAATLYSHSTAVLFPAATNIFVLGLMLFQRLKKPGSLPSLQAPSFWNWVKAQIGIFILWSPWIFTFIEQVRRVDQEFWLPAPGWDTVIRALKTFLNESIVDSAGQASVIWMLYGLVLLLGLAHYRKKISRFLFLAALFAIPFVGELILSIRRPIFLDRTLIWITIPLFLALAAGLSQLKYRMLIIVVLGIFGTINLFSTSDYYRFMRKEDWSDAAGYVGYWIEKGDLVLFNATRAQIPFDYYFKKYEDKYYLQVEKHGVPGELFDRGLLEPKMTEGDIPRLKALIAGRKRVWLVYSHNGYTDPTGIIEQTLGSEMKLTEKRDFYGGQIQFYEAP